MEVLTKKALIKQNLCVGEWIALSPLSKVVSGLRDVCVVCMWAFLQVFYLTSKNKVILY